MRAIILAAGVGRRMTFDGVPLPKVMLSFGGKTLLRRHVEILRHCGVNEIVVAVGFRRDADLVRGHGQFLVHCWRK